MYIYIYTMLIFTFKGVEERKSNFEAWIDVDFNIFILPLKPRQQEGNSMSINISWTGKQKYIWMHANLWQKTIQKIEFGEKEGQEAQKQKF